MNQCWSSIVQSLLFLIYDCWISIKCGKRNTKLYIKNACINTGLIQGIHTILCIENTASTWVSKMIGWCLEVSQARRQGGGKGAIAPPPPCFLLFFFFCLSAQSRTAMIIIPLPHYGNHFTIKFFCLVPAPEVSKTWNEVSKTINLHFANTALSLSDVITNTTIEKFYKMFSSFNCSSSMFNVPLVCFVCQCV